MPKIPAVSVTTTAGRTLRRNAPGRRAGAAGAATAAEPSATKPARVTGPVVGLLREREDGAGVERAGAGAAAAGAGVAAAARVAGAGAGVAAAARVAGAGVAAAGAGAAAREAAGCAAAATSGFGAAAGACTAGDAVDATTTSGDCGAAGSATERRTGATTSGDCGTAVALPTGATGRLWSAVPRRKMPGRRAFFAASASASRRARRVIGTSPVMPGVVGAVTERSSVGEPVWVKGVISGASVRHASITGRGDPIRVLSSLPIRQGTGSRRPATGPIGSLPGQRTCRVYAAELTKSSLNR